MLNHAVCTCNDLPCAVTRVGGALYGWSVCIITLFTFNILSRVIRRLYCEHAGHCSKILRFLSSLNSNRVHCDNQFDGMMMFRFILRPAGIVMGVANTFGTLPGFIGPQVAGVLAPWYDSISV